jgi:hypothetical protein
MDLIIPLVDLAMGVYAENGRVGRVDEGTQLLLPFLQQTSVMTTGRSKGVPV